ncbi:hypothetical protein BIW11_02545 [Tropilaelaps mercedesae]|uniref:Uncharacterized protein n=1 Tax=Tropilaelaps mercedesae TaxID=418985 RepID=A0A1V9Y1G0_9ACAR|nr:hypothetical protein BIW11_02545 [Tropilaelaps mercedesae]
MVCDDSTRVLQWDERRAAGAIESYVCFRDDSLLSLIVGRGRTSDKNVDRDRPQQE